MNYIHFRVTCRTQKYNSSVFSDTRIIKEKSRTLFNHFYDAPAKIMRTLTHIKLRQNNQIPTALIIRRNTYIYI